jgi:hypothetical protein
VITRVFLLNRWVILQIGLRDAQEQFNGVIVAGHDFAIRLLDAHRRLLLSWLPVRTLDVS